MLEETTVPFSDSNDFSRGILGQLFRTPDRLNVFVNSTNVNLTMPRLSIYINGYLHHLITVVESMKTIFSKIFF
jgi:hypothetical protein